MLDSLERSKHSSRAARRATYREDFHDCLLWAFLLILLELLARFTFLRVFP